MPPGGLYPLLTASVVPRPIAWVSTVSADGVANLAPYSFFSVSSSNPPIVQFTSVGRKDSLRNVEQTGEFVINLATAHMAEEINATSAGYDHGVSELEELGIASEPSDKVAAPRVAESPVAIEAVLHRIIEVGNSFVIMGRVVAIAVRPEFLAADGLPSFEAIAPLSRLGRTEWGLPPEVRSLDRPGSPS